MDDEELVRDRFPGADACEEPPIFEHGKLSAIDPGYWSIHADADFASEELGHGPTEELAWADAARHVRKLAALSTPGFPMFRSRSA